MAIMTKPLPLYVIPSPNAPPALHFVSLIQAPETSNVFALTNAQKQSVFTSATDLSLSLLAEKPESSGWESVGAVGKENNTWQ